MLQRPLGDSGLHVSVIGLGTSAMGAEVQTWGYVDDRESIAAIHQALDCGLNLIDTAPSYGAGHSERTVGKAIHGRRDDVLLSTQCGLRPADSDHRSPRRCLTRTNIFRECDESLRRLRTDVIDLYQCHYPDPETPIGETIGALRELMDRGKIRAVGLSNFSIEQIAAAREFGPIHGVQTPYSALNTRAALDLIPYCHEHRIAVLAYGPLVKGLLTGKYTRHNRPEDARARDPEFRGERLERHLRIVSGLGEIATRYEKSTAQLALNWTVHQPGVTAAIVGAKRPSQVLENAGSVGWQPSEEDRRKIETLLRN